MNLSGWGRYPNAETKVAEVESESQLAELMQSHTVVARGKGRAYGDSAIGTEQTLLMTRLNKMIAFDEPTGSLVAESGVTLEDVIATFLPRGWFPKVTPGTKFVTLGGMVAADVHGKNHHKEGSMFDCVNWIELMTVSGQVVRCSPTENTELYEDTFGGMGLTGVILRVSLNLRPVESGWIKQTTHVASNFKEAIDLFEASASSTYSVAWIDCLSKGDALGRALVMLGEHASPEDITPTHLQDRYAQATRKKITMPFAAPNFALNKLTVKAFNALYYAKGRSGPKDQIVHWDSYFYPLDAVLGWNKMYGTRGFTQFQAVLPLERSEAGLNELLSTISAAGAGSFLAVLKRMGPSRDTGIAFPMEGYTLALDFAATRKNLRLVDTLNKIATAHNGRMYLAKDAVMTAADMRRMDPRHASFRQKRDASGAVTVFESRQSTRLGL